MSNFVDVQGTPPRRMLLALLVLTTGRDVTDDPLCPAVVEPAVVVEVRNAVSGDLEADNATGILTDGAH